MLKRKLGAAYFASWVIILSVSLIVLRLDGGPGWQSPANYVKLAAVTALFTVPSLFLYGIAASSLLEYLMKKLPIKGLLAAIISGILLVILGYLPGWVVPNALFRLMGGPAALLFFIFERIIIWVEPRLKQRAQMMWFVAPLLLFSIVIIVLAWQSLA